MTLSPVVDLNGVMTLCAGKFECMYCYTGFLMALCLSQEYVNMIVCV